MIEIPLSKTGKKHAGKYVAIVDDCDADLAELNWNAHNNNYTQYAVNPKTYNGKKVAILLHRVILERVLGRGLDRWEFVDHINSNGLDNRRENLRLATHQQNMANRKIHKNNKSGYKGVHWDKQRKKWRVEIKHNRKLIRVGRFNTLEEAHAAYCAKAIELHGEFAKLD